MTDPNDISQRLETVETQVAFQDQTIEDLNNVITSQWAEIEKLQREIAKLGAHIQEIDTSTDGGEIDERPPHY